VCTKICIHTTTLEASEDKSSQIPTKRDTQEIINIAQEAAIKAGVVMKKTSGRIAVLTTKMNTADLVTESDIECQKIIEETVQMAFPDDEFLGEENVDAGSLASSSALAKAIESDGSAGDDVTHHKLHH